MNKRARKAQRINALRFMRRLTRTNLKKDMPCRRRQLNRNLHKAGWATDLDALPSSRVFELLRKNHNERPAQRTQMVLDDYVEANHGLRTQFAFNEMDYDGLYGHDPGVSFDYPSPGIEFGGEHGGYQA